MDEFDLQDYRRRRRRNVDLNEPLNQQQTENSEAHGIMWGDPQTQNYQDEFEAAESCYNDPHSNQEQDLEQKDQEKTIPFRVGNCEVSIGQLQAPSNSENTQKLTVYLDPELVEVMKKLKKAKFAPSCSWLVSEALKQYLICNGS